MEDKETMRSKVFSLAVLSMVLYAIPVLTFVILGIVMRGNLARLGNTVATIAPWAIIYIVAVVIFSTVTLLHFRKDIQGGIKEIARCLIKLDHGELDVQADEGNVRDEKTVAIRSLNAFSKKLRAVIEDIIRVLSRMAEGDLTATLTCEMEGDWAEIGTALDKMQERLGETFGSINNAADQTSSGSNQVASASQALAQGATEQASAIEQLSATVTEVATHARNNASNATNADQAASLAQTKITEADKSMQQMVQAMGQISDTSNKISNIIKTIDNIAFQTNILALNAAVEAARAGSAGKGFAVVADEVRNLASKSAEAAKDTAALIEESIRAVGDGKKVAEVAEKTLKEVQEASSKANSLVNEIASASNQQAASIGQITQGVQQISSVVQTNSATAEESAAASEELAAQAKTLKSALTNIKVKEQKAVSEAKPAAPHNTPAPAKAEKAKAEPVKPSPKAQAHVQPSFTPKTANDKYL